MSEFEAAVPRLPLSQTNPDLELKILSSLISDSESPQTTREPMKQAGSAQKSTGHGLMSQETSFEAQAEKYTPEQEVIIENIERALNLSRISTESQSAADTNKSAGDADYLQSEPDPLHDINSELEKYGLALITSASGTDHILDVLRAVLYQLNLSRGEKDRQRETNQAYEEAMRKQISMLQTELRQKDDYINDLQSINPTDRTGELEAMQQRLIACQEENDRLRAQICRPPSPITPNQIHSNQENVEPGIVPQICKILEVKNQAKLLPTVAKLNTVLRCVPKMESLIREISHTVFPELREIKDPALVQKKMEILVPSLNLMYQQASNFKFFKQRLCDVIQLPYDSDMELVFNRLSCFDSQASTDIGTFRTLFNIPEEETTINGINQVYQFVHELQGFLTQVREIIGVDEKYSMGSILGFLRNILEKTFCAK